LPTFQQNKPFIMLKTSLSLLALACSAGAHAGDAVTVYGAMDAGMRWSNHAPAHWATSSAPAGGSRLAVVSGGLMSSHLGFKGSEDLGSGWKALFQLEAGVALDTGQVENNVLFSRTSHVGLSNGTHSLYFGREYTTTYLSLMQFDPVGFRAPSQNPNVIVGALYDVASFGANIGGQTNIRVNSAVRYDADLGDFKGSAQYAFGGVAGDASSKSAYGARASAKFGRATFGAGAARMNGSRDDRIDALNAGVKFAWTPQLSLSGTSVWQQAQGGPMNGFSRRVSSVGAFYAPLPFSYGLAFYNTRASNLSGKRGLEGTQNKMLALATYQFTKRVNVYGTMDYSREQDGAFKTSERSKENVGAGLGMSMMF
jgi:predicted porin